MLVGEGWLHILTLVQGWLPASGDSDQPLIWAVWEQMLGWLLFLLLPPQPGTAGLEAAGSSLAAAVLVPRCGQQPRALSQRFPWQPSHPASSLQCQEIKQDDTTAPQKEEKNTNSTPEEHQQPVSSFPTAPAVGLLFLAPSLCCLFLCPGRSRKLWTLKDFSRLRKMLEGWEVAPV